MRNDAKSFAEWPTLVGARVFKKRYNGYILQALRMRQYGEEYTTYELWEPGNVDDEDACPRWFGSKEECLDYAAKHPFTK